MLKGRQLVYILLTIDYLYMLNVTEILTLILVNFYIIVKKNSYHFSRLNISLKFLDVEEEHCFVNISVTLLYRLVRKDEDLCYWQLAMGINWSVIVSMAMWPFSFHLFKLIKYPCIILKQFLYSLFCGVFCFQSLINLSNVSFQLNLETWQLVYRTHP